jgi:hypothetical protein
MSVYVGFYRIDPDYAREVSARSRAGEPAADPRLARLVVELIDRLPAGCKLLGAYNTMAGNVLNDPGPPGILIVDTSNGDDLLFISQYYSGYLQFQWHPARSVGATREEREAATAAALQPVR